LNDVFVSHLASVLAAKSGTQSMRVLPGVDCAVATAVGLVREENQDRGVVARGQFLNRKSTSFLLLAIADGLGGMKAGAECATQAISHLLEALISSREPDLISCLKTAIYIANESIYGRFRGEGGSTLSALLLEQATGQMVIANVGDSRIYRFNPTKASSVEQLTVDDTLAARLPQFDGAPKGGYDPDRNRLIQFIGIGRDLQPSLSRVDVSRQRSGYLLTTDGVHSLGSELLSDIVAHASSAAETTERLITLSNWAGGQDNSTVICAFPRTLERFFAVKSQRASMLALWTPSTQCEFVSVDLHSFRPEIRERDLPLPNSDHKDNEAAAPLGRQQADKNKIAKKNARRSKRQPQNLSSKVEKKPEKEQMKIRFLSSYRKDVD
jgi:serine/threonine protein phosphatase PrpC